MQKCEVFIGVSLYVCHNLLIKHISLDNYRIEINKTVKNNGQFSTVYIFEEKEEV